MHDFTFIRVEQPLPKPLVKCRCAVVRICRFWNRFNWKLWT